MEPPGPWFDNDPDRTGWFNRTDMPLVASRRVARMHDDARLHTGFYDREEGVIVGGGVVPVGWTDCAWDYEQPRGFNPIWGARDAWGPKSGYFANEWQNILADLGWNLPDLSDEAEEWEGTDYARVRPSRRTSSLEFTSGDDEYGYQVYLEMTFREGLTAD